MGDIYSNSYSQREGYLQASVFGQEDGWIGFRSERRCFCGHKMRTNGNGDFRCEGCGFKDYQDVTPLYEAGLCYPMPNTTKTKRRILYGSATASEDERKTSDL